MGPSEDERVPPAGGCAPHTPIPDEPALRAALGPPTHPRISSLWGLRPHAPTRISSAPAGSEDSGSLSLG